MRLSRRPTEGRPVGSIRRSGRPAALPANPPAPARSSPPATTHPSSRPPRENRRSLLPPPLPPRAGWAFPHPHPERLWPEETPSLHPPPHRRGGRETCPRPFRPRPHPPPAPGGRIPLPPAHCPPETPRAPHLTAPGISAALPSRPGPPFRPAPAGETALPAACPLIGAARFHARPGRPAVGGNLPAAVLPDRPFCPRPAARPRALPASGRPFLSPEGRLYSLAA